MNNNNNKQKQQQRRRRKPRRVSLVSNKMRPALRTRPAGPRPRRGRGARPGTYGIRQTVSPVSAPIATGYQMRTLGTSPTVVTHMEYLDTLRFREEPWKYDINPGLTEDYPWLSRIARNFEKYRIKAWVFEWIPSCPTTTTGAIQMAFDYDARDTIPTESQMMSYNPYVSGPLWNRQLLVLNPAMCNQYNWHFTRSENVRDTDIKTYDIGSLIISCNGESEETAGKLMVKYIVEFAVPTLELAGVVQQVHSIVPNDADGMSKAMPFKVVSQLQNVAGVLEHLSNTHICRTSMQGSPQETRANCMLYKALRDFTGELTTTIPEFRDGHAIPTTYVNDYTAHITDNPEYVNDVFQNVSATPEAVKYYDGLHSQSFTRQLIMKAGQFLVLTSATSAYNWIGPIAYMGGLLMNWKFGHTSKYASNPYTYPATDLSSSTIDSKDPKEKGKETVKEVVVQQNRKR